MKQRFAVIALLGLAIGIAQAGNVTSFTDDFTGSDGTSIFGSSWGYADQGVELSDWAVHPRTAAADVYEIQSNAMYAEVTPLETADPAEYNKIMSSIYPIDGGSQASLSIGADELVTYEIDLMNIAANEGHRWSLNQEVKLVLTDSPAVFSDPNSSFDNYVLKLTVRPNTDANAFRVIGTANSGGAGTDSTAVDVVAPAGDYPYKMRMTLDADGNADFYLDDMTTSLGTVTGTAMGTVYPYVWVGKFNGGATVLTEGNVVLDNYLVEVGSMAGVPGDANGDGAVTDADYTIWADTYQSTTDPRADFNGDGTVTDADYTIWADNYGVGVGIIPEPMTLGLLALGAVALKRRR
jgi:hypothetical protein